MGEYIVFIRGIMHCQIRYSFVGSTSESINTLDDDLEARESRPVSVAFEGGYNYCVEL